MCQLNIIKLSGKTSGNPLKNFKTKERAFFIYKKPMVEDFFTVGKNLELRRHGYIMRFL